MGNQCSQQCQQCADRPFSELTFEPLAENPAGQEETIMIHQTMTAERVERCNPESELPRLRLGKQDTWMEAELSKGVRKSVSSTSLWSQPSGEALTPPPVSAVGAMDVNVPRAPFVEVVFNARGQESTVRIYRRPLGADFIKEPFGRIKIGKVEPQSHAWGLGIEKGWTLKSVNGEDVLRKTFEETQAALKSALAGLPQRTQDLS